MDSKRFLLALALSIAVIFAAQFVFPSPTVPPKTQVTQGDSLSVNGSANNANSPATVPGSRTGAQAVTAGAQAVTGALSGIGAADSLIPSIRPETTTLAARPDSGATYSFSNIGAAPVSVIMNAYRSRSGGADGPIDLAAESQFLKYQLVTNSGQQVDLSQVPFGIDEQTGQSISYSADLRVGTVKVRYEIAPDGHIGHVSGSVTGPDGGFNGGYLVVSIPQTFGVVERDSSADVNALAFSYHSKREGSRNVSFRSLDPGETELVEGPVNWVAGKNKYFVVGLLAPDSAANAATTPFTELKLVGGARLSKKATHAAADVVVPITNGTFAFDFYAGPQEWRRLHSLGRNFEEVNPYGWGWMRGFLQPIATAVIRLVIWMHNELHIGYGLVLILLGVIVRIVLWPLNQIAMRSSMKMQELQPKIQEVQARYKDNPQRQREEMMKVYSDQGMSPLSPLMGCLSMMLPMPVLFALFFVFQNTIEFRGVSFLWLNDLSAHDPLYLLPVLMAGSMYFLSMLSMRGTPPNPQAKMMMYFMPVMFLVFLGRAASGLNLYYAAQNLAALPQQWLLTKERVRRLQASQAKSATSVPKSEKQIASESSPQPPRSRKKKPRG